MTAIDVRFTIVRFGSNAMDVQTRLKKWYPTPTFRNSDYPYLLSTFQEIHDTRLDWLNDVCDENRLAINFLWERIIISNNTKFIDEQVKEDTVSTFLSRIRSYFTRIPLELTFFHTKDSDKEFFGSVTIK